MIINSFLKRRGIDEEWTILVFANDIFILACTPAIYPFADIIIRVLAEVYIWAIECSVEFSYDKCMYTVIPPKGKMENNISRVIWIDEHKIKFFRQIKYLGVVFDWDYSWMKHLDFIQEKETKDQYKLCRIVTATRDLKPEVRKAVYSVVADCIVLYEAPIWYSNKDDFCRRRLSIRRGLQFCVTKCYSMVSTDVLNVLSGVFTWTSMLVLNATPYPSLDGAGVLTK